MRKYTAFTILFFAFLCFGAELAAQARRTTSKRTVTKRVCYEKPVLVQDVAEEPVTENPPVSKSLSWPECSETDKINISDKCEAYPWLSGDGLRLYFTSNRDGGHGNIYFSERTATNMPFGKAEKMFRTKENRYYAASLTNDELTMYITMESYTLYVAERKSKTEPFGEPRLIPELKEKKLFGPGISPDGKEMMVVDYGGDQFNAKNRRIEKIVIWYVKGTDGRFVEKGRLDVPEGKVPGPGQIGKDGLTFYCSMTIGNSKPEHLYCFTRTALGGPFSFSHQLADEVNVTESSLQPSVNDDGTILAYVINNDGMWNGDDIRVVQLNAPLTDKQAEKAMPALEMVNRVNVIEVTEVQPEVKVVALNSDRLNLPVLPKTPKTAVAVEVKTPAVEIYPNPFKDNLVVSFLKPVNGNLLLELFDATGKRVLAEKISGAAASAMVKTTGIPSGTFTCRITGTGGVVYSGVLVSVK